MTADEVEAYAELIEREAAIHQDPPPSGEALSADPDDEYLIDLARAVGVDALVSGDAHLLDLRGVVPAMTRPGSWRVCGRGERDRARTNELVGSVRFARAPRPAEGVA